jgi:hypothetical protein
LIVKGPAPIVQSDSPQLALAPTPAPSIATTAPTPSAWARKQQWRAMNEAFCNEMQETREALLAAKAAGDFQQVNEVFISFLPLLTFSSSTPPFYKFIFCFPPSMYHFLKIICSIDPS